MIHDRNAYPRYEDLDCQKEEIYKEEWDCLVVLDACRWDALNELVDGDVRKLRTPAESSTPDWMMKVWEDERWDSTTYLSANTFTTYVRELEKYGTVLENYVDEYIECWKSGQKTFGAVEPGYMVRKGQRKEPPIVLHLIQPHTPFIGDVSLRVRGVSEDNLPDVVPSEDSVRATNPIYRLVESGNISPELARTAYVENLKYALEYVEMIKDEFGSVVVTSDHGECLGPDEWSHGSAVDPRARVVPWLEL